MIRALKEHFHLLKTGVPGERFQQYYRRKKEKHPVKMIIKILAGCACLLVAILLTVTPAPALVFFILCFALISAQSFTVAKMLDAGELKFLKLKKNKKAGS